MQERRLKSSRRRSPQTAADLVAAISSPGRRTVVRRVSPALLAALAGTIEGIAATAGPVVEATAEAARGDDLVRQHERLAVALRNLDQAMGQAAVAVRLLSTTSKAPSGAASPSTSSEGAPGRSARTSHRPRHLLDCRRHLPSMPKVLIISTTDLRNYLAGPSFGAPTSRGPSPPDLAAGIEAMRSLIPSLVVIDGGLPDAPGAIRQLREDPDTRPAAIVAVSRQPGQADAELLRAAGANVVVPAQADPLLWDACLDELLKVPRRREARIPVRLETWSRVADGGDIVEGSALNISVNGILFESPIALEIGLKLDLRFRIPGHDGELQALGEVVRQDDRPRSGIKFLVLRGNAREVIRAFVEKGAGAGSRPGVSVRATEDLTEGTQWEAALRERKALKAAMLVSAPDAVLIMNHEGRIVETNRATERILGYSRTQMVGRTIAETFAPPSDEHPRRRALARHLATGGGPLLGQRMEITARRASGDDIPAEITVTRTHVKGKAFFTAHLRDITNRKRAERLQRALYRIAEDQPPRGHAGVLREHPPDRGRAHVRAELLPGPAGRGRGHAHLPIRGRGGPRRPRDQAGQDADRIRAAHGGAAARLSRRVRAAGGGGRGRGGGRSLRGLARACPSCSGDAAFGVLVVQSYSEAARYAEEDQRHPHLRLPARGRRPRAQAGGGADQAASPTTTRSPACPTACSSTTGCRWRWPRPIASTPAGRAVPRPRPLQGHQRLAGPQPRRPAAAGGGGAAAARRARGRHRGPPGRRRVHLLLPRHRARGGRGQGGGEDPGAAARCPSAWRAASCSSPPASASASTPRTAPTPRR